MAIAYLISGLFYYITVIIPQKRRCEKNRVIINNSLEQIAHDISMVAKEIQKAKGVERNLLDFNIQSGVLDGKRKNASSEKYLLIGDYVIGATSRIREECKSLLGMFYLDLPVEAIVTINNAMNAYINREEFSSVIRELKHFEVVGDDIFEEYRNAIEKLKECKIN